MSASAPEDRLPQAWQADLLRSPPLIAPVRQFTYPQQIPGEEDTLARGAMHLLVHPAGDAAFLATCALGFTDPAMPTGIFACPNPHELCAVAGGYAYILDTTHPERSTLLTLKPVVDIQPLPAHNLLLFAGFHSLLAWGANGPAWQTARLSWEGLRIASVTGNTLHGFGWNMLTDREVAFTVDLLTGHHQGGGFPQQPPRERS